MQSKLTSTCKDEGKRFKFISTMLFVWHYIMLYMTKQQTEEGAVAVKLYNLNQYYNKYTMLNKSVCLNL